MTQQPLHIGYRLLETERDKGEFQNIFKSLSKRLFYSVYSVLFVGFWKATSYQSWYSVLVLTAVQKPERTLSSYIFRQKPTSQFFSNLPICVFFAADYKNVLTQYKYLYWYHFGVLIRTQEVNSTDSINQNVLIHIAGRNIDVCI